jgi:F-type H+-transporting ATPase subunit alpha
METLEETGKIEYFFHNIAVISGLSNSKLEELLITETGKKGIVFSIRENNVEALMIDIEGLKVGERVKATQRPLEIPVGEKLLGRIINPLCEPLDKRGKINQNVEFLPLKREAPPVIKRARIKKHLETGVIGVDLLVPLGYGQRELIVGDPKTGKTTFLLQALTSQIKEGAIGIYVGIGKKDSAIKIVENYLKETGAFERVIIIHTPPDESSTLLYLAPFSGMTIAEHFRDKGENVLIVFDDLSTHAKIYREISLLLKRVPGRDCYPGDIFHLHANLLERAGNIKKNGKEVSITALPVGETLENDISGYITTNLMAMTDGHIFFDVEEFRKGKRPAINYFLSVSRVGNQTKYPIERMVATLIRKILLEYKNLLEFLQFSTEISPESEKILELGKKLEAIFSQSPKVTIKREAQLIIIALLFLDFWHGTPLEKIQQEVEKIAKAFEKGLIPPLGEKLSNIKDLEHLKFLVKRIQPSIEKILK